MFTPEAVEDTPTPMLRTLLGSFEWLGERLATSTDYKLFVIEAEAELERAVHVLDSELRSRRRPALRVA